MWHDKCCVLDDKWPSLLAALQKSLSRLSSGRRIVTSSDDAGGLAVSMKMAAAQKRTEATGVNLNRVLPSLERKMASLR